MKEGSIWIVIGVLFFLGTLALLQADKQCADMAGNGYLEEVVTCYLGDFSGKLVEFPSSIG